MTTTRDLDELEDIIDDIVPDDMHGLLCEDGIMELLLNMAEEYVQENALVFMEEDFPESLEDELFEMMLVQFEADIQSYEHELLRERIQEALCVFFETIVPPRSYEGSELLRELNSKERLSMKRHLRSLLARPQPKQRTQEWYEFRHTLITASNAYKALMTGAEFNQIVFEKCQPLRIVDKDTDAAPRCVNVETTLHWGQKFEDVSVMIYEDIYKTRIEDFGCIRHDKYRFLGASPDGINMDEKNPRFGRMLEIKNVVNRDITGVPKLEYWVQMQLQMETCGLDECDFLETRFKEYGGEEDYFHDLEREGREKNAYQGVIMYFSKRGAPVYKYSPLNVSREGLEVWDEHERVCTESEDVVWVRNIYWKLEEMSCVLVTRNKMWFSEAIQHIERSWRTIERERVEGYQHRAPARRTKGARDLTKSVAEPSAPTGFLGGCMLNIKKADSPDDASDAVSDIAGIDEEAGVVVENVLHIRTESIDETKKSIQM